MNLKNCINLQFVTLENRDERSRLVPVLDTILKLSPEETHKLNEIVSATGGGNYLLNSLCLISGSYELETLNIFFVQTATIKRNWIPGWSSS